MLDPANLFLQSKRIKTRAFPTFWVGQAPRLSRLGAPPERFSAEIMVQLDASALSFPRKALDAFDRGVHSWLNEFNNPNGCDLGVPLHRGWSIELCDRGQERRQAIRKTSNRKGHQVQPEESARDEESAQKSRKKSSLQIRQTGPKNDRKKGPPKSKGG